MMRSSPRNWLFAVATLFIASMNGCGDDSSPDPDESTPPLLAAIDTVVLVTIDTLRADRLGCYGYENARTPVIDRIAEGGVRFERCLSTCPMTLPSHASILSGTDPIHHGARVNGAYSFDPSMPTLATAMKASGFQTSAAISAFVLDSRFGLAASFDHYDDRFTEENDSNIAAPGERPGEATVARALQLVDKAAGDPMFLWVHLFDPHTPFVAPLPFSDRHDDPYDAEVEYADHCVGQLLDGLRDRGRLEQSLLVITADHGEGLGDHGEENHTVFTYDSTLHVPLVFWCPQMPGGRVVKESISTTGIAPTILELIGADRPLGMYGQSRAGPAREAVVDGEESVGEIAPRWFESLAGPFYFGFAPLEGIEWNDHKLIIAPRSELYRPRTDPGELNNLYEDLPDIASKMRSVFANYRAQHARSSDARMASGDADKLAELGYVGGLSGSSSADGVVGPDPKDRIEWVHVIQGAQMLLGSDPARAASQLEEHAKDLPDIPELWNVLGVARMRLSQFGAAQKAFGQALELSPNHPALHTKLGMAYLSANQIREAADSFKKAREKDPTYLLASLRLGQLHARYESFEEAESLLREVLDQDPAHVEACVSLVDLLISQDRSTEAAPLLDRALAQRPSHSQIMFRRLTLAVELKENLSQFNAMAARFLALKPGGKQAETIRDYYAE